MTAPASLCRRSLSAANCAWATDSDASSHSRTVDLEVVVETLELGQHPPDRLRPDGHLGLRQ